MICMADSDTPKNQYYFYYTGRIDGRRGVDRTQKSILFLLYHVQKLLNQKIMNIW